MLNGETQRRVLLRYENEEMTVLNILFFRVGIESNTSHAPRFNVPTIPTT